MDEDIITSITTEEFIKKLWETLSKHTINTFSSSLKLIKYGRIRGWLEDQDERFYKTFITRRTAARILHQFMLIELKIPDDNNISSVETLKDLYTCRNCVNHIAQIIKRELLTPIEIEQNGHIFQIFGHLELLKNTELEIILEKLKTYTKTDS